MVGVRTASDVMVSRSPLCLVSGPVLSWRGLRRVEVTPRHVTWLTLTTRPAERESGGGGRQEEDGEVEGEGVEEEVVAAWIPPSVSDKCRRRKARASVPTSASFSATRAWPASSTHRT